MTESAKLAEALELQLRSGIDEHIGQIRKAENMLYHYTGLHSLMGMLETNNLWMSKGNFLNDSSELVYFSAVLEGVIEKMKDRKESGPGEFFSQQLAASMEYFLQEVDENGFEVYIFSLSNTQDSLALWYNYAGGDGYNLGFSAKTLLDKVSGLQGGADMLHGLVEYDRKRQEVILWDLLMDAFKLTAGYKKEDVKKVLPDHFFSIITICAIFFKDPTFQSEEEYRIALLNRNKNSWTAVKFRARNGVIIPYIAVDFEEKLPLGHITIGPKNNIDIAQKGMEHYVRSKGYDLEQITISKSVATLRY